MSLAVWSWAWDLDSGCASDLASAPHGKRRARVMGRAVRSETGMKARSLGIRLGSNMKALGAWVIADGPAAARVLDQWIKKRMVAVAMGRRMVGLKRGL